VPVHDQVRPLRHNVIRVHTMLFDDPFAAVIAAEEGEAGSRNESAVPQGLATADANQTAPCPRPDDGSDLFAAEEPGERVAA